MAEQGRYTSYSACGLPYLVAGDVDRVDDLVVRTPVGAPRGPPHRRADRPRGGLRSTSTGAPRRCATSSGSARSASRSTSSMFGTGARPIRPDLPGIDEPWVHGVQTLEDGSVTARGGRAWPLPRRDHRRRRLHRPRDGRGLPPAGRTGHARRRQRPRDGAHPRPRPLGVPRRRAREARGAGAAGRAGRGVRGRSRHHRHRRAAGRPRRPRPRRGAEQPAWPRRPGLELGARDAIQRRPAPAGERRRRVRRRRLRRHLRHSSPAGAPTSRSAPSPTAPPASPGINLGGGYATFPGVVGTAVTKVCDSRSAGPA